MRAYRRWRWVLAALLAALIGCREGEVVTVSGAVARPGDCGYRPGKTAAQYVTAAGGYLPEADTARAYQFRALPDTAGEATADDKRVSRWTLDESPGVMPGDRIAVPFKSYAIRLDTARAVKDLVIKREGKVYRVPEGVVVPGWSARGVMAAVVIGDGEVRWEAGGRAERSGFHYLYLRMHPGQYEDLLPAVGEPVADREALEDAEEVHRRLFQKSAYRDEDRAQVPPEGYLRVLAGVWPAPRNRFYPGPGMRKKRYPDGRVWTTFPDGRQRMEYPDGKVVVDFPDSSQETRYPDGSVEMREASGSREMRDADGRVERQTAWGERQVTFPDGRVERRDAAGNLHIQHPDGREEWALASGTRTAVYPDGRRVYRYASGTVRTVFPNGVDRTVFADGGVQVKTPDGTVKVTAPSGKQETRYTDGRVEIVTGDSGRVTIYPDGRQVARLPDGTRVERYADGRQFQRGPLGATLETAADGTRRTVYPDGTEMVQRADGSRVVRSSDGSVLEEFADGRRVQTDARGNRLEVFPDGRQVQTDAEGNRVQRSPDGTLFKTFVDPYRYRGAVREDLIELDGVPDRMAAGEEISLSGSVPDSVRDLWFAIFELPDGDVVDLPVRVRNGRFQGELKVEQPGRYRLQCLARLGEDRTVVADDRAVAVGITAPLPGATLEIPPYPGPEEGARRLIALMNRARDRLGRRPLLEDIRLSEAARDYLQEMLVKGYFAHRSPTEGTVDQRLERRGIPFASTTENLGHAPSVEEVHGQLMSSAGHREAILDGDWTHVGAAVAWDRGEVWAVQIFVRR